MTVVIRCAQILLTAMRFSKCGLGVTGIVPPCLANLRSSDFCTLSVHQNMTKIQQIIISNLITFTNCLPFGIDELDELLTVKRVIMVEVKFR